MSKQENMNLSDNEMNKVPGELAGRSGEWFCMARRKIGLQRENIADLSGKDYTEIIKFEIGGFEITEELWQAYLLALNEKVTLDDFGLRQSKMLMRGLVNEFRLY